MITADLVDRERNQLLTCSCSIPKRITAFRELAVIEGGCIAALEGQIVFAGGAQELEQTVELTADGTQIDGSAYLGLPDFVDSHTHLPFDGSREEEFLLRLKGYTHLQLSEKGMGIQTTVNAARKASNEELVDYYPDKLDSMLLHGTTTAEAKSGYGLNLEDEIKQLEAIKGANLRHPIDMVPTSLDAREVSTDYKSRKENYIDLLTHEILPKVIEGQFAEYFDAYCEINVYSIEETERLIKAAMKEGLKHKIHADEFVSLGGTLLAAKEESNSADHLIAISEEGIRSLAESNTVATLLPSISFFLMHNAGAPARKLIDSGAVVALATDFNSGSSMTESLFLILQLAVYTLKTGAEEAIHAVTANAAFAIDRGSDVGSLELGKQRGLALCIAVNCIYLIWHFGINSVKHVIKNGKIVVKDGQFVINP